VDLPEHGRRKNDAASLVPWTVVPELRGVMELLKAEYSEVSVRANSIGAWFAMQAFQNEALAHCLFVSPILDMRALIENMMAWAGVTEERLRREGEIPTEFGEVLSWRYYSWVKEHPVLNWDVRTDILYAGNDTMTNRETAGSFAAAHSCGLTVMENGEHWFHTAEQLDFLRSWEDNVT
ncbi:MAG: alpha/beta hydrolase, partial [Clostridiales bacterium]|nr:alpha/beta hydrolase [Clostridiales bacterium]